MLQQAFFLLLTIILTVVKEKLQPYCAITYARSGVNQMWILKNSKERLANLKAQIELLSNKLYQNIRFFDPLHYH
jgi:hypothetical protein